MKILNGIALIACILGLLVSTNPNDIIVLGIFAVLNLLVLLSPE